jgi:uncharacterized membrane protein
MDEERKAYQMASRRVAARLGFYMHLGVYLVVSLLLVGINLGTSPGYLWFPWPIAGWGIGVLFHAAGVYLFAGGSKLRERMIERELKKDAKRKHSE